jgi:hypothetical protein
MTGFTWEYLGSWEDFGYRDAQSTPRSPDTPEHGHHKTPVPHGTHRYLATGEMTSQDRHDRDLPRGCLTCRQELAAVSRADQSWIIASILSRRPEETWSYLACGTGIHKTFHEANIFRDKRRHSVVFDTYVRIWRAGGRLCGLCLLG